MKITKFLFLLISLFILTSCSKIMVFLYGAHAPRPETPESIFKYLKKKKINDDNIYFLKDSMAFYNYFQGFGKLPSVKIYNNDLYLLDIIKKDTCSGQTDKMIRALSLNNSYPVDSSRTLEHVLINIMRSDGNEIKTDKLDSSDFFVLMYWAKFTGKLNKKNIAYWEEQLRKKEDSLNLTIFKINCDPLESWWSEN